MPDMIRVPQGRVLLPTSFRPAWRQTGSTSQWTPLSPATKPKDTKRKQQLWPVLESYVHMTNNRLGILNKDEPFIAYFIKESFLEL